MTKYKDGSCTVDRVTELCLYIKIVKWLVKKDRDVDKPLIKWNLHFLKKLVIVYGRSQKGCGLSLHDWGR